MGIIDKIGHTALKRKHDNHISKMIIAQFNFKELKDMCLFFNIGSPHPWGFDNRDELVFYKPTFDDWKKHAFKRIKLVNLREYAEKHHKLIHEIIQLEKKYAQEMKEKYPEYETMDTSVLNDDELLQELIKAIKEFQPIKHFDREDLYHTTLFTYLQEKIPAEIGFEKQRGRSIPDIEVGDIAIEVKGPTDKQGLQTIADKMLRYPLHYKYIIIVLFDVDVYEPFYKEWYEAVMRKHEGQVTIIRNDSASMAEPTPRPNENVGYCIRCEARISFNPKKPLCEKCYPSWVKYSNYKYPEKFCHICGKKSNQSYSRPVCYNCWKSMR